MANMRVYELAKELNITTKDIADLLDNNNKTYKTMSGLNDDEVAKVRGKFGHKSGAAGNASKPKNEKANEAKMTENNTPKKDITKEPVKDTADKKSHVSELYFPQNSSKGGKDNKNVKNDNSGANRGNAPKNGNSDNRNSRNDNRPNQNGDRNGDNRGSVIMITVATETEITEISVIMTTVVTETDIKGISVIMITVQTRMVTEIITVRVDFQIRAEEMTEEIRHLRMISFLRQSLIQEDLIQEKIIIKMTARKMWKLKKILNLQIAS